MKSEAAPRAKSDTSVWLDAIRSSAALAVLVGHAFAICPIIAGFPNWPQQLSVAIFFTLSGFLITQTLRKRLSEPGSRLIDFTIDRWARIYSGFLPALILIAVLDQWAIAHFPGISHETIDRSSMQSFLKNLFMLQEPTVALPFGSGAPLWSVAVEFWIYLFVGLLAFSVRDGFSLWRLVLIIGCGLIPMNAILDNNSVFIPWLLGAMVEQIIHSKSLERLSRPALWLVLVAAIAITAIGIYSGERIYAVWCYCATAVAFAAIVATSEHSYWFADRPRIAAVIAWWAGWSYTLYLLHHTVVMTSATVLGGSRQGFIVGMIGSIVLSIFFAMLTERHHKQLAQFVKTWLTGWHARDHLAKYSGDLTADDAPPVENKA